MHQDSPIFFDIRSRLSHITELMITDTSSTLPESIPSSFTSPYTTLFPNLSMIWVSTHNMRMRNAFLVMKVPSRVMRVNVTLTRYVSTPGTSEHISTVVFRYNGKIDDYVVHMEYNIARDRDEKDGIFFTDMRIMVYRDTPHIEVMTYYLRIPSDDESIRIITDYTTAIIAHIRSAVDYKSIFETGNTVEIDGLPWPVKFVSEDAAFPIDRVIPVKVLPSA